jgi:putative CocE/NonD family hydrolase
MFGLPPARNDYTITSDLPTPTRDGAVLLADHYAPRGPSRGTVLIRSPYGRGLPLSWLHGRMFAARGYHVVVQSVRGTAGSTGTFQPMTQEAQDGQDAVAWLRDQPWFDGRLATLGGSYLGWTQWALLRDPPPELKAAVVLVGPHDIGQAIHGSGTLALADFLGWSTSVSARGDGGVRGLLRTLAAQRRMKHTMNQTPMAEAVTTALAGTAPWFADWLSHPDLADPFWTVYDASDGVSRVAVPVLLTGGWQDTFLDQTLQQYRTLRACDVEVALTIGPWTHLDTAARAARVTDREALAWLDQHLADGPAARDQPVRIHVTGAGEWRTLPTWPPQTGTRTWYPHADGQLGDVSGSAGAGVEFTYDPADPTPAVGGRHMSPGAGVRDNRELEARPDVVTFTSDPLESDVEVIGTPSVTLAVETTNPHADLFVRLCDVDKRGHSRNVTERFVRLDAEEIVLDLGACAHRFTAGHRLRLQISGGAHPRFVRNPGTGEDPATATSLKATRYSIRCDRSAVRLPI